MEKEYTMKELVEMIEDRQGEFCINIILGEEDGNGQDDEK